MKIKLNNTGGLTLLAIMLMQFAVINTSFGQCKPMIKIDGKASVADPNDKFGISFPVWLKATQTIAVGSSVNSISIIEFTVNGTTLEFSQVLNITSTSSVPVPAGKVWKVETVVKNNSPSDYTSATFTPGTYTWQVPACAEQICVNIWGGGGGGGGSGGGCGPSGAGGGGGGFGYGCFSVTPGSNLTVIVGLGGTSGGSTGVAGTGGTSSIASLGISATGGTGGTGSSTTGGTGGTSTGGSGSATGGSGLAAGSVNFQSGGSAINGGLGGTTQTTNTVTAIIGSAPGGGGGAANGCPGSGGAGGGGRVTITW